MNPNNWKDKPGGIDALNLSYIPETTKSGFPVIKNQDIQIPNRLIMYKNHKECQPGDAIHFFIDDYRFEHLWTNPKRYLNRLSAKTVLTPDFSLYTDYPDPVLRWNVYRNRWLGAFWQFNNISVIPTISWSTEESFLYCFEGIETGATVAISTRGVKGFEDLFSSGIDELIKRIQPCKILCYGNFRKHYEGHNMIENLVIYENSRNFGSFNSGAKIEHKPLCGVGV